MRAAKTLIRLGGFPGLSESSLGAHSFCWFCHVAAHMSTGPPRQVKLIFYYSTLTAYKLSVSQDQDSLLVCKYCLENMLPPIT